VVGIKICLCTGLIHRLLIKQHFFTLEGRKNDKKRKFSCLEGISRLNSVDNLVDIVDKCPNALATFCTTQTADKSAQKYPKNSEHLLLISKVTLALWTKISDNIEVHSNILEAKLNGN
jgi:hypothetical protein